MASQFGIVTAPKDRELPDSLYDMPELQNNPKGGAAVHKSKRRKIVSFLDVDVYAVLCFGLTSDRVKNLSLGRRMRRRSQKMKITGMIMNTRMRMRRCMIEWMRRARRGTAITRTAVVAI